jgi:hypothetical protein
MRFIFLAFFSIHFVSCKSNTTIAEKDSLFAKSLVTEISIDYRFGNTATVKYIIGGKEFNQSILISSDKELKIGDSLMIRFQKSNPANCEIMHTTENK